MNVTRKDKLGFKYVKRHKLIQKHGGRESKMADMILPVKKSSSANQNGSAAHDGVS